MCFLGDNKERQADIQTVGSAEDTAGIAVRDILEGNLEDILDILVAVGLDSHILLVAVGHAVTAGRSCSRFRLDVPTSSTTFSVTV